MNGRDEANRVGGVTSDPMAEADKEPVGTDEVPVLDTEQVFRMVGRDNEVIKEFVGIFVKDISEQMRRLEDAVGSGDRADVEKLAHRIKGASGDVGGMRLYRSVSEIEDAARDNSIDICNDKIESVSRDFRRLKDALEKSDWG